MGIETPTRMFGYDAWLGLMGLGNEGLDRELNESVDDGDGERDRVRRSMKMRIGF